MPENNDALAGLVKADDRPVLATMKLTYYQDGGFFAEGPLDNRILCYGMLEMARDIVQKRQPSRLVRT